MYDVVALGELLIDFTMQGEDALGFPALAAHPGGAPANFLAALAKFGAKTALIGKVGADAFGRRLLRALDKAGIDKSSMVVSHDVFTTLAFVTLDWTGEREFSFSRKPGADTRLAFEEVDLAAVDGARVFHFGTLSLTDEPSRSAAVKTAEYAKARGKLLTFDPNYRPPLWESESAAKEAMLWGLGMADVVKLSDSEAEFLFCCAPREAAERIVDEYDVQLCFVTCGAEGVWYKNEKAALFTESLRDIRVMDTTGAGDIFGGAAVWKLLQYDKAPRELEASELSEIAAFASAAAGLSVTRAGGMSSVPELGEVEALLTQRREKK